ncbi:MAG: hypothetical protein CK427_07620 [Leptospira sp.]|nr:MAG: hypothetical protein CK427_07620 [Leptospira sp.]
MKKKLRLENQQFTRSKILDSSEYHFSKYGFSGAAVDSIVKEAGYSRGAFYSNFSSKEDLFLSLMEARMEEIISEINNLNSIPLTLSQKIDKLKEFYINRAQNKMFCLVMSEFLLHSIRDSEMKDRIIALNRKYNKSISKVIENIFKEGKVKPNIHPDDIAVCLLSFGEGLMIQHFADPNEINKKRIISILENFFKNYIMIPLKM